jgi:hypothetical protein
MRDIQIITVYKRLSKLVDNSPYINFDESLLNRKSFPEDRILQDALSSLNIFSYIWFICTKFFLSVWLYIEARTNEWCGKKLEKIHKERALQYCEEIIDLIGYKQKPNEKEISIEMKNLRSMVQHLKNNLQAALNQTKSANDQSSSSMFMSDGLQSPRDLQGNSQSITNIQAYHDDGTKEDEKSEDGSFSSKSSSSFSNIASRIDQGNFIEAYSIAPIKRVHHSSPEPTSKLPFTKILKKLGNVFKEAQKALKRETDIGENLKESCINELTKFQQAVQQCQTESDWKQTYKSFKHQLQLQFHPDNYLKGNGLSLSTLTPQTSLTYTRYENMMKFLNKTLFGKLLIAYKSYKQDSAWIHDNLSDVMEDIIHMNKQCEHLLRRMDQAISEVYKESEASEKSSIWIENELDQIDKDLNNIDAYVVESKKEYKKNRNNLDCINIKIQKQEEGYQQMISDHRAFMKPYEEEYRKTHPITVNTNNNHLENEEDDIQQLSQKAQSALSFDAKAYVANYFASKEDKRSKNDQLISSKREEISHSSKTNTDVDLLAKNTHFQFPIKIRVWNSWMSAAKKQMSTDEEMGNIITSLEGDAKISGYAGDSHNFRERYYTQINSFELNMKKLQQAKEKDFQHKQQYANAQTRYAQVQTYISAKKKLGTPVSQNKSSFMHRSNAESIHENNTGRPPMKLHMG